MGNIFQPILQWVGSLLKWLDEVTGSYMLALLVFAVLVEILMLPLSIYQHKNTVKQSKLRPKEMAIKKKYAGRNDQATMQKMRMELNDLYQREGYSPTGGCLPLLIQLPVILALYNVVIDPMLYVMHMSKDAITAVQYFVTSGTDVGGLGVTLTSTRGTLEIVSVLKERGIEAFKGLIDFVNNGAIDAVKELGLKGDEVFAELEGAFEAGIPNLFAMGINLGRAPIDVFTVHETILDWLIILVPIVTFVVYYFTGKLTRKLTYQSPATADADVGCSNKIMDIGMPAMSTYFAFILPAAIGIYWMFRSVLGTFEKFLIRKAMPYPKFTEEDYKEAEREIMGRAKKRPKRTEGISPENRAPSRHRPADEDADEYAEAVRRSLESKCELSRKSPYYDGPELPEEETLEEQQTEESATIEEAEEDKGGLVEKMPLKEDKNDKK